MALVHLHWQAQSGLCSARSRGNSATESLRIEVCPCRSAELSWASPPGSCEWKLPSGIKINTFCLGWNIPSLLAGSILVAVGTSIFNSLTFVCTSQIVAVMFSVTKVALGKVCRGMEPSGRILWSFSFPWDHPPASSGGFLDSHSSQGATKHKSSSEGSVSASLAKAGKSWQAIQSFKALKLVLAPDPPVCCRVQPWLLGLSLGMC